MRPWDALKFSFGYLFRKKAQSSLTILQMMVGVFLISIMLSVGNGLKEFMVRQITLFSSKETISVRKSQQGLFALGLGNGVEEFEDNEESGDDEAPTEYTADEEGLLEPLLTTEDLKDIRECEYVEEASFQSIIGVDYVRLDSGSTKKLVTNLYTTPLGLRNHLQFSSLNEPMLKEETGIILTTGYADAWGLSEGELIGRTVWVRVSKTGNDASSTFGIRNLVASDAENREFEMKIIGFIEKNVFSSIAFITPEMGNTISAYMSGKDIAAFEEDAKGMQILVIVDSETHVPEIDEKISDMGFMTTTYDESAGQIGTVFDIISAALTCFGVIALIVSSIGTANSLLMSIYQRMREIGVMMAVGATRKMIGVLFTLEAIWLGLLGGVFGMLISWVIAKGVNTILHEGIGIWKWTLMEGYLRDYPTLDIAVYTPGMITMIMSITIVVSILSGLYPALQASKLDPIDALKHT